MSGTNWDDLKPRVLSGVVMAVVGAGAVWAGGLWFIALISISCGLMAWELVRMVAPELNDKFFMFGFQSAVAVAITAMLPPIYSAFIFAPLILSMFIGRKMRLVFAAYLLLILLAGYGFIQLRQDLGLIWMLWMLLVVVVSDIGGYAAGRMLGGPKFWPAISPKKTWSGTVAGWIGAALVGLWFSYAYNLWDGLIWVSVVVAFAAQMGDIAESAIKRKTGIKDSSNLIPGHGGFMDRFDGMLGASVVVVLLVLLTGFPFGAG